MATKPWLDIPNNAGDKVSRSATRTLKIPERPLKDCNKTGTRIDQEVMNCYEVHYEAVR